MAHLPGGADEIRALVPAVLESYTFVRDNVLQAGLVGQSLKELCYRYLAEDPDVLDVELFEGPERAALEWTHAIAWNSDLATDELWERLHGFFSEPELVDLGCAIGFELGQQHWRRTLGLPPRNGHLPPS